MSELRTQIEQARAAYGQLSYRGDLAADVLPMRVSPVRRWRWFAAGAAIAASIAAGAILMVPHRSVKIQASAVGTDLSIPAMPQMPQVSGVVPDGPPASMSGMPAWPAMDALAFDDSSQAEDRP